MALFSSASVIVKFTKINRHKVDSFSKGFEFLTYNDYAVAFGAKAIPEAQWIGQDAAWLRVDREKCFGRWRRACIVITKKELIGRLMPFSQISSYYKYIYKWIKRRNHEIKWLNGAYYLVNDLADSFEDGVLTLGKTLEEQRVIKDIFRESTLIILKRLNLAIFNYAIVRFNRITFGTDRIPAKKAQVAYDFDEGFIENEQRIVAPPVYSNTPVSELDSVIPRVTNANLHREGLKQMNQLFNGSGFLGNAKVLDWVGIYIPVFSDLYNSDLTNSEQKYGEDARVQVPLAMLYPNKYFYNSQFYSTKLATAFRRNMSGVKGYDVSVILTNQQIFSAYEFANFRIFRILR